MPVYPMLTDYLRNRIQNETELGLYDYFQSNLPEDHTVIYGKDWTCNFRDQGPEPLTEPLMVNTAENYFPLGEIDFLLITPKGLLVIEVKGGEVFLENGVWYSIDRYGSRHNIQDPLHQARKNRFAVLNILRGNRRFFNRFINIGYVAILPHTLTWHQTIQNQKLIIFKEDIKDNLIKKMGQIINYWRGLWDKAGRTISELTTNDIKYIVSVFAPTTQLRKPSLRYQIDEFQQKILTLTEKQFEILTSLEGNRKAIITGGAGTGKTLLAMEKARQIAMQGHKTLFTCPNRLLSKFVSNYLGEIDNLQVMNFHELCYRWGVMAGSEDLLDPDGENRYEYPQEYYSLILPLVLEEATFKITDRFDAIIVDEAQDMNGIYWSPLERCLVQEDPIFYIFCDPNQTIWHIDDELPYNFMVFRLQHNLRNSRKIFEAMEAIRPGDNYHMETATDGEYKIVHIDSNNLLERLAKLLSKIFEDGISGSDIAIITGRSGDQSILAGETAIGNFQLTTNPGNNERKILFSSVRRFRGMESPVVIMIEIDYIVDLEKLEVELGNRAEFVNDNQILREIAKETLLIGMSRAQHSLYIMADKPTREWLKDMGLG